MLPPIRATAARRTARGVARAATGFLGPRAWGQPPTRLHTSGAGVNGSLKAVYAQRFSFWQAPAREVCASCGRVGRACRKAPGAGAQRHASSFVRPQPVFPTAHALRLPDKSVPHWEEVSATGPHHAWKLFKRAADLKSARRAARNRLRERKRDSPEAGTRAAAETGREGRPTPARHATATDRAYAERLHASPRPEEVSSMFAATGADPCAAHAPVGDAEAGAVRCHKVYFRTQDGLACEASRMQYPDGSVTVCVSSQVGCRHQCSFCEAGSAGLVRNLSAEEILAQVAFFQGRDGVLTAERTVEEEAGSPLETWALGGPGEGADALVDDAAPGAAVSDPAGGEQRVDRVCFHGMGEPLDNPATFDALSRLRSEAGASVPLENVSVSTIGILPGMQRLLADFPEVRLTVSLHTPFPFERMRLVSAEASNPLADVLRFCRRWQHRTGNPVTLSYLLLPGENDTPHHAAALASLVRGTFALDHAPGDDSEPLPAPVTLSLIQFSPPAGAEDAPLAEGEAQAGQSKLSGDGAAASKEAAASPSPATPHAGAVGGVPASALGMRPEAARLERALHAMEPRAEGEAADAKEGPAGPAGETRSFADLLELAGLRQDVVRLQHYCEAT